MIRAASPADAALLAHIDAHEADGWDAAALADTLRQPTSRGLLADDAGFALVSVVVDEGELLRIVVRPELRGAGIGRRLLVACHDLYRRSGVVQAFLEVRVDNLPARRLYEHAGWREVGRRPAYYADGTDALVLRWLTAPRGS